MHSSSAGIQTDKLDFNTKQSHILTVKFMSPLCLSSARIFGISYPKQQLHSAQSRHVQDLINLLFTVRASVPPAHMQRLKYMLNELLLMNCLYCCNFCFSLNVLLTVLILYYYHR